MLLVTGITGGYSAQLAYLLPIHTGAYWLRLGLNPIGSVDGGA